jgi:hypothetical protein
MRSTLRTPPDLNPAALEAARIAVEDTLVELRDSRISILTGGNGFVIREPDGRESSIMRLSTRDGLRIGIAAYLAAVKPEAAAAASSSSASGDGV